MAGGMNQPRRPYDSIADRIAATGERDQQSAWLVPPAAGDTAPLDRLRHGWVSADEHGQVPGLLLEWRDTPEGWQGSVVPPVLDRDGDWRSREEWLPAGLLAATP